MLTKIVKVFFSIISIILLIGLIILVVLQTVSLKNNKPIKIFNHYYSQVISKSMEDELMVGDYISYKKFESYELGDIIVFEVSNDNVDILVVHRIIQVTSDGYITKGDNRSDSDFVEFGYIKESDIYGKVVKSTSFLGLGKMFLNSKNILIIVIILIVFILIFFQIIEIVKLLLKRQREEFLNNK